MALQVVVDRELCIGSEMCGGIAPNTFTLDGEGKAMLVDDPQDPDDVVRLAVASCPVAALKVTS
jgi:ferredoxin